MNTNELKTKFNIKNKKSSSSIEDLAFGISLMITEARVKLGLTQAQLAKKMGTKQPSIARVENGGVLPSLEFLLKMAKALGTDLVSPYFEFLKGSELRTENITTNNQINSEHEILYIPFRINLHNKDYQHSEIVTTATKEFSQNKLINYQLTSR